MEAMKMTPEETLQHLLWRLDIVRTLRHADPFDVALLEERIVDCRHWINAWNHAVENGLELPRPKSVEEITEHIDRCRRRAQRRVAAMNGGAR